MSELEGGNQTVEDQVVEDQIQGDEETPTEEPEEFDEITYNKETIKIPKSQRQTFLQKGYNYDKVHGRLTEREQLIATLETETGYSINDLVEYARNQKTSRKADEMADNLGMSPEQAKVYLEQETRLKRLEHGTAMQRVQDRNQAQKAALKNEDFFTELEAEIDQIVTGNPSIDVETAYNYLYGQNRKRLTQLAKDSAAKKAVEDHKRQSKRSVESSSEAPVSEKGLDFAAHEKAWAERRVKQGHYKSMKEAWEWLRGKRK